MRFLILKTKTMSDKKYIFEITTMQLQKNRFGENDIIISKVKVMNENGKYIKFAKLNEALIAAIKDPSNITIFRNA